MLDAAASKTIFEKRASGSILDGNMVDHKSERSNETVLGLGRYGGSSKSLRSPTQQLYNEASSLDYSSTNMMEMVKKRNSCSSTLSSRRFHISTCSNYSSRFKVSMMIVILVVWCCCFLTTIIGFQYFPGRRSSIRKTTPTIIQVSSSCSSRRFSSSSIQATKHEHIMDDGDNNNDSREDGSRNISNNNSHTPNNDDMVNVQKRAMTFKRRMKALSAKFLDDNGLELVMERKTGIITARPKEQTTTTYAAATSSSAHAAEAHHHHHHDDSSSSSATTAIPTTVLNDVLHNTSVKKSKAPLKTISAKYLDDNGLELVRDIETGAISAQPAGRYDFDEEDGQTIPKYQPIVFSIDKHEEPTVNHDVDISTLQKPSRSSTPSESTMSSETLKDSISNSLASSKRKGIERAIASIEKTKEGRKEHTTTNIMEERASATKNKIKKKKTNLITKMPKIIDNSAKRAAARAASQQQQQQQVLGGVVVGAAGLVDEAEYYNNNDHESSSTTTILDNPQQQQHHHSNKPKITSTRLREKHKRKIKAGIIATPLKEHTPKVNDVINPTKQAFNVVLTHCTADFDSLASAVGLAKLWSSEEGSQLLDMTSIKASTTSRSKSSSGSNNNDQDGLEQSEQDQTIMSSDVPTYVVLPRGAHPAVARFLGLHKHLFPIRSLKSLPHDLSSLNRLGLVDAQRRDRVGPAEPLLGMAKRVTILDHHIDGESDIPEASDYVVEQVGSVSTMVVERIQRANVELSEAEATLLALGIHADTGSLCFDSTTPRDAMALAYCMQAGASQPAIAEHAQSSLSEEQNSVLTQALLNTNSTLVHGVTVTTVLLSSEGFINGLAAVAQDVLELTSSGVLIFAVVYDPKARSSSSNRSSSSSSTSTTKKLANSKNKNPLASAAIVNDIDPSQHPSTQQLRHAAAAAAQQQQASAMVPPPGATAGGNNNVSNKIKHNLELAHDHGTTVSDEDIIMFTEAWKGGEQALKRRRLQAAFTKKDIDGSGYLERQELSAALSASGVIASKDTLDEILNEIDSDGDGKVNYDEFEAFAELVEERQKQLEKVSGKRSSTMIMIGRVKTGINVKSVNLNTLFQPYGGGGHAKAASATVRLEDSNEAEGILQNLVDELIETSLLEQPTVGEFMTSPVLSAKPTMTETQVEDLFSRYDVRALPVVDDDNNVIGLVTYKEVAAAKQRLWNKQQKHLERERKEKEKEQQRKLKEQQQQANENSNNTTMADSNVGGNNNSTDDSTIRNSGRRNNNGEGRANNNYANKDDVAQERQRGEKIRRERRQSLGSALKGWMKQHVRVVEASTTLTEAEEMLLENDVGCIPVVADGTKQLVGMVTRTDILRQHRYYPSLHYHNKGFSDSIEARKPIIELRKRLKKFDLENE